MTSATLESRGFQSHPARAAAAPSVLAAFLCGFNAFLDLYCVQPLLPVLARIFHSSEGQTGLLISASTLGVAFSAALLALFGEQLPRKRTIVLAITALAVLSLLTATATSLGALVFWRLLQGLVTPGIFTVAIAYVTEEWPAAEVPRVMSIYVAGTVFGGFVGRIAGGLLGDAGHWRAVFILLGFCGLLGALAVAQLLRPGVPRPQRQPGASVLAPALANLRNPRLLATYGIGFCMLYALVSVFSYITFYLAAPPFRLSPTAISSLFGVYIFGLLATLAIGPSLGRIGLRRGMLGAVGVCLGGTLLTLVPSLWVVGVGLAFASCGVFIAQACANSFLRDAAPLGARVSAAGIYICCYYVGGTLGGVVPGVFWRVGGWPGCAALTSALLVVAGFTAFYGWRARTPDPIAL